MGKLADKLAKVYSTMKTITKDKKNAHFNYKYASAESIFEACRSAMSKVGLALIPMMGDTEFETISTQGGKASVHGITSWTFVIADTETGFSVLVPWQNEAIESSDKYFNKVATTTLKSFLKALFMIPTGDDAEDTDSTAAGAPEERAQRGAKKQPAKKEPAEPPKPKVDPKVKAKTDEALTSFWPGILDKTHEAHEPNKRAFERFKNECAKLGYKWLDVLNIAVEEKAKNETELVDVARRRNLPIDVALVEAPLVLPAGVTVSDDDGAVLKALGLPVSALAQTARTLDLKDQAGFDSLTAVLRDHAEPVKRLAAMVGSGERTRSMVELRLDLLREGIPDLMVAAAYVFKNGTADPNEKDAEEARGLSLTMMKVIDPFYGD